VQAMARGRTGCPVVPKIAGKESETANLAICGVDLFRAARGGRASVAMRLEVNTRQTTELGAKRGPHQVQLPPIPAFDTGRINLFLAALQLRRGRPVACEPGTPAGSGSKRNASREIVRYPASRPSPR